jgi:hypothetical protein
VELTDVVAPTDAVADGKIGLDGFFSEAGTVPPLSNKSRRFAIAYIFQAVHCGQEGCPNKAWNGKGGILPQIKEALDIVPTTDITYILDEFLNCEKFGMVYMMEAGRSPENLEETPYLGRLQWKLKLLQIHRKKV